MNTFKHSAIALFIFLTLVARGNSIHSSAALSPNCWQINSACRSAGFIAGGETAGIDLVQHCVLPTLRGIPRHPGAKLKLPHFKKTVVGGCRTTAPVEWRSLIKGAYTTQWDIVDTESNTGILRDWPSRPQNFLIPNYSQLAQDYEEIAFVKNNPKTHRWANVSTRARYQGESIMQPAFLLDNRFATYPHFSESLVVFPGILSSAMRGVDMTDLAVEVPSGSGVKLQRKNIVRMMKAYYHSDPVKNSAGVENGLFTDHFQDSVGGGNSFWYQLGPNVYAMQIQSVYEIEKIERGSLPTEPSLDDLTHRMTDTLFRMSEFLKGSKTTSFPSFDFSGVRLMAGGFKAWDPNCRDERNQGNGQFLDPSEILCDKNEYVSRYEPDAAGAFAMIGVMAYDRWKDPKYLKMAEGALNFLSQYDRNPVYELDYNFGVTAAARMNRLHGKNFDIHKLMRWAFVRSEKKNIKFDDQSTWPDFTTNARPDVGLIAEHWGNFPVHGLWGAKSPYGSQRGYAFLMNTLTQAINLAPVAKYYPGYATMMAKYLLHVASNARFFFPRYMPSQNQHHLSLAKLQTLKVSNPEFSSIPYEGLKRNPSLGAVATGDPLDADPKWAETNQSFYSGALTGMFASLMIKTSEEAIPFWDLNKSDFQSPQSYPTYLVYNPTAETKTVILPRNKISSPFLSNRPSNLHIGIWDAVSKLWLEGTTGDFQIQLLPGQARVITLVPGGHVSIAEQGKVKGFDYTQPNKPFAAIIDYEMR